MRLSWWKIGERNKPAEHAKINQEPRSWKEAFPQYYGQMYENLAEILDLLTIPDLIQQTHKFMENLGKEANDSKGNLSIFFLDKSARPVGYFARKLWQFYVKEYRPPALRFINIGKKTHPTIVAFNEDHKIIRDKYSIPLNGPIIVVDEFVETGETLNRAVSLLKKAYPKRIVKRMVCYSKPPLWHDRPNFLGVVEPDIKYYESQARKRLKGSTTYNRIFSWFLNKFMSSELSEKELALYWSIYGTRPYVLKFNHPSVRGAREELRRMANMVLYYKNHKRLPHPSFNKNLLS